MLLYRFMITVAAPVLALVLLVRVLRGKERWQDLRERLGARAPRGAVIWLHGASNGELTAARPLIDALAAAVPQAVIMVSCNTVSAKAMVKAWGMPQVRARLAPLDLGWMLRRMLAPCDLMLFILIEGDFWPNRIACAQHRAPCALVGGRVSKSSARSWSKFPALARRMFGAFELVAPQDAASQERLGALGATPSAMADPIALKSLARVQPDVPTRATRRNVWLAASTHEGEDDIVLHAHLLARKNAPDLRMILAPRHARGAAIAKLARQRGLTALLRSDGHPPEADCNVYIADTLGEMDKWYARAGICFVAGSLVPKGGHTPFEPAAYGCALIHGPHVENFAEPYAALQSAQAACLASDADTLAAHLGVLQDMETAEKMSTAARSALQSGSNMDSLARALARLANGH